MTKKGLKDTDIKNYLESVSNVTKEKKFYYIEYKSNEKARLSILNSHVFRYYMSPTGDFQEYPTPNDPSHEAKINSKKMSDYDIKAFEKSSLEVSELVYVISTDKIEIRLDKANATMSVIDKRTTKEVMAEVSPLSYENCKSTQTLRQNNDEFYFGGGMQNGRFTHKGNTIDIVNTNNWIDGGVASPCPFYWSSYGYGVLRNTWQPGFYDFSYDDTLTNTHDENQFDAFYFINAEPKDILNDYYELTGQPFMMPEYAFYEAHLNAFNRDYWVKVDKDTPLAILFEDGEYYKCYQPDQLGDRDGTLESLNGEKNNYQFSARAMVDRYKKYDMPLGWFVPNDGYGSGYGQTDSLDGDIQNLKDFADYARDLGVEVALWTESNLHPSDPENPKKGERDLTKEVSVAGVVALKADVAWIGSGYSFGLSSIENAAETFVQATQNSVRPMVIMVDGWAGTQRCSGIWSGDQRGGEWEYIRFHIPTYIGTGLSGQPNIGSDMDGIYAGGNKKVNVRDYQWKTFTPLQLNMDGWGWVQKTPFSFDTEATDINRAYLKLKSMFMPYNYTIAHESINGLPMVRAMFLEFPNERSAFDKDSQYQFMWGPNILVAPVYNDDEDSDGNSIRKGIYLPDPKQVWVDMFTGDKFQGGKILYDIKVPLWKTPVFIKEGSVIPMTNPNNNPNEIRRDHRLFNIYPYGEVRFEVYEDDGISTDYLKGHFAITKIVVHASKSHGQGDMLITINKTDGNYKTFVPERTTQLQIMASKDVESIKLAINGESVKLQKVKTKKEFNEKLNVFFFDDQYIINPYLKKVSNDCLHQKFILIKIHKLDITKSTIQIKLSKFTNDDYIFGSNTSVKQSIKVLDNLTVLQESNTATSITLNWEPVEKIRCYEIERDGILFTNIKDTIAIFDGFKYESEHKFRVRSMTDKGVSEWSNTVTGTTKEDPWRYTVKGVKVTCNLPCQPNQEIDKLTDMDCKTMWHTKWENSGKFNKEKGENITLKFDLKAVYEIEKIEYYPRNDAGNGNISKIVFKTSEDGEKWSTESDPVEWEDNARVKTIYFTGRKFRYLELSVWDSMKNYGSGKHLLFYKKIN